MTTSSSDLKEQLQKAYDDALRNGNTQLAKAILRRAYGRVVINLNNLKQEEVWEFDRHE